MTEPLAWTEAGAIAPGGRQSRPTVINLAPGLGAAHGGLRLVLELDGDAVERADPHIGFAHRGTEKLVEQKTWLQALAYFDRLDQAAPISQAHAFVLAVERLAGIVPPPRGQALRVLFAELGRIANHLLAVTGAARDLGAITPCAWAHAARETLMGFCERVSGARLATGYLRPGGVMRDLPPGLAEQILADLGRLAAVIDDIDALVTENRVFKQRTVDVAVVTAGQALDWGLTGPVLRASGVAWDLRKAQPYDAYGGIAFDVPVGQTGDCYARTLVRIEEMRQSLRIVRQCLDTLPDGPVAVDDRTVTPPPRDELDGSIEAMIDHVRHYTAGLHVPAGETYVAVEAPKGEFGVYLVADGTGRPYRCRIRSPGFAHLQALNMMVAGHLVADTVAAVGSLDLSVAEIDR